MLVDVNTLKSVASLGEFCETGKGSFVPLTMVYLKFNSREFFTAYATDRYTLIRAVYDLDIDSELEGKTVVLTLAQRKFINAVKVAKHSKEAFIFELDGDTLTISFNGLSVADKAFFNGSIPDFDKFIGDFMPAIEAETLVVNPALFAKAGKVIAKDGSKVDSWSVGFGKRVGSKPSPIRLIADGFVALIQPRAV